MIEVWAFWVAVAYGPETAEVRFRGFPNAETCEQFRHEFVDLWARPKLELLEVWDVGPRERTADGDQ